MENSPQKLKAERFKLRAWQSASARLAIIYGLIALYAAIMIPFIPIDGAALINDTHNSGFIFAVLTSFACVMLGIYVVNKLRKFGNGAIYTLHRIYFWFLLIYCAFTTVIKIIGVDELYTTLYYYSVFTDIAFGIGLLFIQLAQFLNPRLHVTKAKGWYLFSCILTAGVITGLSFLAEAIINYSGGIYYDDTFYVFYSLVFFITGVYLVINWFNAALPVNDFMTPFGGKFFKEKTATSKVGFAVNTGYMFFLIVEAVYFVANGYYILFYTMIISVLLVIALIVWAALYNADFERKLREKSAAERAERLRVEREKAEAQARELAENQAQDISAKENADGDEQKPREKVRVYCDDDAKYLVKASALSRKNAMTGDPYAFKLNVFTTEFVKKMRDFGVLLSGSDASSFIAAMASSRMVFVSGVESSAVKPLISALSQAFDTNIFVEKYYDKFLYEPKYEEVIEYTKAPNPQADETAPEISEKTEDGQEAVNDESLTDGEKTVEKAPELIPVVTRKEIPFVRDEKVIKVNKKHGIVSGIFTANCLRHFVQAVFFDATNAKISMEQKILFRAVAAQKGAIKVGLHDYLPETEFYDYENIEIPDNMWAVCFVNDFNFKRVIGERAFSHCAFITMSPDVSGDIGQYDSESDDAFLSFEGIASNVEEAEDDNYLSEESWKKIDKIVAELKLPSDCAFDNRFIRQTEIFASVQMATGKSEEDALDFIIAYKILPYVASCKDAPKDLDRLEIVDRIVGLENAPLTKKMILDLGLGDTGRKTDDNE